MSFDRFRSLVLRLATALKPLQDVFRSLPSARAMSFDRFRALAPCLSIASERSRYVFRSLSIALDRFRCLQIAADVSRYVCRSQPMSDTMSADRNRCLTRCLQIATDVCRCLTLCLQIATDLCRCLQIAANVDRYVNPLASWPHAWLLGGVPPAAPTPARAKSYGPPSQGAGLPPGLQGSFSPLPIQVPLGQALQPKPRGCRGDGITLLQACWQSHS